MLSNSLSKCNAKLTALPQKMANLCKDNNLYSNLEQNQTLKNKLKVLHLASDIFQGGAESVFRNTIELTSKHDDFIIYTASCDKNIKDSKQHIILDDYQNYNKLSSVIKYIFNFKNLRILNKSLNTLKPDIIHTQNYLSRLSPSVLFALKRYKKKNPKIKLIYTQHTFGACANSCFYNYSKKEICESCTKSSKLKIIWKNCDRRGRIYSTLKGIRTLFYQGVFLKEQNLFDKIIFVSNFQLQKHIQDGYDKNKLQVITNPIDYRFYNKDIKLKDKENLIIFFGRISMEKNIPLLLFAFKKLINEKYFQKYKLLIIGSGSSQQEYKNIAKDIFKDISMNDEPYKFINHLNPDELKNLLLKSKISVLPSLWYETFGLSIVESILSGVIPIVSEIGALKETKDYFGGKGFRVNDIDDLCNVMKNTLLNYEDEFNNILSKREILLKNNQNYCDSIINLYKER